MPDESKWLFLGAGHMAEALIKGLLRSEILSKEEIRVTDLRSERLEYFKAVYGVEGSSDNQAETARAERVVVAVKPQGFSSLLKELKPVCHSEMLLISIAAGISTAWIENLLIPGVRVVRVMPNTPALVGEGMAAVCAGAWAEEADLALAEKLLSAAGEVVRVEESAMDAVTVISGSGPAYLFYLMEAMQEAASRLGLDEVVSRQLIMKTVEGAVRLVRETGESPGALKEKVASRGGVTEAVLGTLEEHRVQEAFNVAIQKGFRRSRELGKLRD